MEQPRPGVLVKAVIFEKGKEWLSVIYATKDNKPVVNRNGSRPYYFVDPVKLKVRQFVISARYTLQLSFSLNLKYTLKLRVNQMANLSSLLATNMINLHFGIESSRLGTIQFYPYLIQLHGCVRSWNVLVHHFANQFEKVGNVPDSSTYHTRMYILKVELRGMRHFSQS